MSKLINLIGRLGQQSAQPIGFGALASRADAPMTMALICVASASELADGLGEDVAGMVDAVLFDGGDADAITALDGLSGLVWGVRCGALSADDVDALVGAGCDFFLIDDARTAPGAVVSYPDAAKLVALSEPADMETAAALGAMRVAGSVNTSGAGAAEPSFADLVNANRIGASTGGVMLLEPAGSVSVSGLTALRDAGVDGLVTRLSDSERVARLAEAIRELPARRKRDARGMQAAAPGIV